MSSEDAPTTTTTANGNDNGHGAHTITSSLGQNIQVSQHPVLLHKITTLRSSSTHSGTFRSVLREVTYHLGFEATSSLTTRLIPVSVCIGKEGAAAHATTEETVQGHKIVERVALIPILRSGLGMTDGMLELLPNCAVHHIGMYRLPGAAPVQYFSRLPRQCTSDVAIVLDPVIGSASTVLSVVATLKKWGVPKIHIISVLGSRGGLEAISESHPDVHVTVGMIDDILTEDGIVLPGLGDPGDRLFGTPILEDDDALLHPSKRKRSDVS